jgi:predicted DNA-binding protein (MmcQ/YjbR family)
MVSMEIEAIRRYCLKFPHATENIQWGYDLCLKVDGKLFAVMPLEPAPVRLSFKCSPEMFAELCERPGVRPAPYMARAQWVALEQLNTLPDFELRELLAESYRLVFERLPKKRQQELSSGKSRRRAAGRKPASVRKKSQPVRKAKRTGAGK